MDNAFSQDTIVALASGRGEAGVAVIRLSGDKCATLCNQLFVPAKPGSVASHKLVYGTVAEASGEPIDDCLLVQMPGPRSFTGEDVAEIQCHGSSIIISRIIERCLECGARLAEPGEFSRRAFFNGKMDLTQAEALSDLIASKSEAARKLALKQLRGGLSSRLKSLYSSLVDAAAEIEAHIDFPEEDIPDMARERILGIMSSVQAEIRRLLEGHRKARVQAEGARVVLVGEPNAGKSSLFNALMGRERAIVSPHPGTTRDTIEATLEICGLAITLVDTAGIREAAGEIEKIGIDRTHQEIRDADLILWLRDGTVRSGEALSTFEDNPEKVIRVFTKSDLAGHPFNTADIAVSSTTGQGIDMLEQSIRNRLLGEIQSDDEETAMSRARQADQLSRALDSLTKAQQAFTIGESGDLVMVDLRDALSHLGETWGERLDEQILDRIFSTFCLGK